MKFIPRLNAPSYEDRNWLHYTMGGTNYCIKINGGPSVLPNCVGYAWGRWSELLGQFHRLSRGNAENWFTNTADGYARGQEPKVGAVACWRKGQAGNADDGAGHVAIVEEVYPDGSFKSSNSGYGGTRFWTQVFKKSNNYYVGNTYVFQGFIYLPITFEEEPILVPTPTPVPTPTELKFKEGDRVVLKGQLYGNSDGEYPGQYIDYKVTEITRVARGKKCPYNTTGDLGWVEEGSLTLYVEPVVPTPPTPTPLSVGDTVVITGKGNANSYGTGLSAGGIGWTRQILDIAYGRENPYRVGNEWGTTGWYKETSLRKI